MQAQDNSSAADSRWNCLKKKTEDVGKEKHVPVIEKTETGVRVKVGHAPHPMEEKHYIEWIKIIAKASLKLPSATSFIRKHYTYKF